MTFRFAPFVMLAAFVSLSMSSTSRAADWCGSYHGPNLERVNAANSSALSAVWLQAFDRLAAAIPALSPREEAWLEGEINAGGERTNRAYASREIVLREARRDVVVLANVMRRISDEQDHPNLIRRWLVVVAELLNEDPALYYMKLVENNTIPRDSIPSNWEVGLAGTTVNAIRTNIIRGRISLARAIISCTLPSLGIGSPWDEAGKLR